MSVKTDCEERKEKRQLEFFIDPEFRDKLPALSDEEFAQLRENILTDGYVDKPLVVWRGSLEKEDADGNIDHTVRDYLIDGHNRWKIIQEHPELPYKVVSRDFPNKWAAIAWIYKNQKGQRNLSDLWQMKVNAEITKAEIKAVGAQPNHPYYGNQHSKSLMDTTDPISSDAPKSTVARVAKDIGVPEGTLKKQLATVRGLDAADEVDPGFQTAYLNGEIKAPMKDVRALRLIKDEEERKAAVEAIKHPEQKPTGQKTLKEQIAYHTNPDNIPEYEAADLREDINAVLDDCIEKLHRIIDLHMDVATDNPKVVLAAIKEFETKLKEVKERVK